MKCIVCHTDAWCYLFITKDRMLGISGSFREHQCVSCGLRRMAPIPTNIKKYYPPRKYYSYLESKSLSFFGWLRKFCITHELFWFVPAMPKRGKRGKILDVGCGSGDTLLLLKSLGWDVYGMDIDKEAVRMASKRGLTNVIYGSDKEMHQYPDNNFDCIRLYHVIEHVSDPGTTLKLAKRKLKPGGELIIGTPNGDSLLARIAGRYWYNLDRPRHVFIFSPFTLNALATRFGLRHVKTQFVSAGGWIGSLQYLLQEKLVRQLDLVNSNVLIILWYPFEWMLDRLGKGDVFVTRFRK